MLFGEVFGLSTILELADQAGRSSVPTPPVGGLCFDPALDTTADDLGHGYPLLPGGPPELPHLFLRELNLRPNHGASVITLCWYVNHESTSLGGGAGVSGLAAIALVAATFVAAAGLAVAGLVAA